MQRRHFITLLGGAATWPLVARAQQKAMPVIGFLSGSSPGPYAPYVAAFRQGLSETGYIEGQNVAIEYRWAEDRYDRLPALAADLVGRKVDVIAASAGIPSALAAKGATSTILVVFMVGTDPVRDGLVASLARPGGNLTGLSFLLVELNPKRLELLSELVPQAKVIALLVNPNNTNAEAVIREVQEAAREGAAVPDPEGRHRTRDRRRFCRPCRAACRRPCRRQRPVFHQPSRSARGAGIAPCRSSDLRIPSLRRFWRPISYGPSLTSTYRQLGIYTGKILNGAKPADLPVEQPTRFELVVNLKTAKALGLTVPPSILARADEVIE